MFILARIIQISYLSNPVSTVFFTSVNHYKIVIITGDPTPWHAIYLLQAVWFPH